MKFPINSGNPSKDISSIDWCTAPNVTYDDANRNKDVISATLFCRNGDALIQKSMEMFYRKAFMVTFCENIIIEMQTFTYNNKCSFKRIFIVHGNKMTYTEFYEDIVHKSICQQRGIIIMDMYYDYKLVHVTHRIHKSYVIIRIFGVT